MVEEYDLHCGNEKKNPVHNYAGNSAHEIGKDFEERGRQAERRNDPAAQAAMRKEWDRLRQAGTKGCWDETAVESA